MSEDKKVAYYNNRNYRKYYMNTGKLFLEKHHSFFMRRSLIYGIFLVLFLISLLFISTFDLLRGNSIDYSETEITIMVCTTTGLILSILLIIIHLYYKKGKKPVNVITFSVLEFIVIISAIVIVSGSIGYLYPVYNRDKEYKYEEWKIGIYEIVDTDTINLSYMEHTNPVITKNQVVGIKAGFVADPLWDHECRRIRRPPGGLLLDDR